MSNQNPIEAKDTKIMKVIADVLKKTALQTVNVIETTSDNEKYDRDIYHHSGLDLTKAADKKTAVEIKRSKKDPDDKDKKIISSEIIPRKAVLNFNTRLKQMWCAVFSGYGAEVAHAIDECVENEKSLKKGNIIMSLIEQAEKSDDAENYHYLPLILTLYRDNVVNNINDTTLKTLRSSVVRSRSVLADTLMVAYPKRMVDHPDVVDELVMSYLYLLALFSMDTATRVWIEAKIPEDDDSSKKKTKVPKEEQATKLISTKTIDLNAYKTFMLNKMHSISMCTKMEYDYIITESDAIVKLIDLELQSDKDDRKAEKAKNKKNTDVRKQKNASKSVKGTARDEEDEEEHPPTDNEEEEQEQEEEEEDLAPPDADGDEEEVVKPRRRLGGSRVKK
jgi:hypothetical protein